MNYGRTWKINVNISLASICFIALKVVFSISLLFELDGFLDVIMMAS